ncbi:MAG: spore coat U domain-containing protein [Pseudomonadota bacterium]|nr:spore coat U domain-containing protein [Pseudomonadota bacterium]
MKRGFLAVLGVGVALQALPAFGAGSNSLSMSATVVGTCKVITPPGVLDFGDIDPSGSSNVTATTTFAMKCTKSTVSTAGTDDGGLNLSGGTKRMKHSVTATAFLPYAVSYSGAAGFTGLGFGAAALAQTITVNGTVTPAQYQNALVTAAGQLYSDTVIITVNP